MDNDAELVNFLEDVVETQVTEVLTAVSMDNSSSIPVMSVNVTGSVAGGSRLKISVPRFPHSKWIC